MRTSRLTSRAPHRLLHRVAALAVLALQLAMASSAVWEPRPGVRLGAHAEQGGTRDPGQHNEESCLVCAVRAQASAVAPSAPSIMRVEMASLPLARAAQATSDTRAVSTRSRAPPSIAG